jgi:serine/threonine protein kinase
MALPWTRLLQAGQPASLADLWPLLRAAGLTGEQLRRLSSARDGDGSVEPFVEKLVQAGVLTAYQAEQVLAGKPGRLRLGPYRILDRLGSGGAGTVYKAEHRLMKRLVALKVLGRADRRRRRPAGASPGGGLGRRAELVTAGRLSHPHIVAAYDAARLRGRLVLVLEYVEGIDLARLVAEAGPLPVPLACEVIRQAALALNYLHERGLVHRDVKPANLLLMRGHASGVGPVLPDGPPVVKLIDMGLACRPGEGGPELCGTMDYIAPERGIDPDAADIRGDLYSLGCTFYHLLTGRVPFPGGSWTGKLIRHRLEDPELVRELRPDVDEALGTIVERLMARNPRDRFSEPASVAAALGSLVSADRSTSVSPVTVFTGETLVLGEDDKGETRVLREDDTGETHALPEERSGIARRFGTLGPWVLLATVLAGGTLGGAARLSIPSVATEVHPPAAVVKTSETPKRITVSGIEQPFAELGDAVSAAAAGVVVTLDGPGPFRTSPILVRGKALTIRAAAGVRPVVERQDTPGGHWDALLASDSPLTLEGIDLNGGHEDVAGPVVSVQGTSLDLRDCSIQAGTSGPLVALRGGEALTVRDCRLAARMQAMAVEIVEKQPCRVAVEGSHVEVRGKTGPALLLWSGELGPTTRVQVEWVKSTVKAGRIVACRSLAGPVEWKASDNHFGFQQGLVSFDGYREGDAWRRVLRWNGRNNRFDAVGPWLRLEDGSHPAASESAWERLWAAR